MTDLTSWKTLLAVAEHGSLNRAAEKTGVAKSVLSRRLAQLEGELGAALVRRSSRGLTLTETGAVFCERARAILADVEEVRSAVSNVHGDLSGTVRMTLPLTFGLRYVSPLLNQFMQQHPRIKMEVQFTDRPVNMIDEGLDLALRLSPVQDSELIARRLCPIRYVACASADYLRGHDPIAHAAQLANHSLLAFSGLASPGTWHYVEEGVGSGSVSMPIRLAANNGDHLVAAAACGLGVIVEPTFIVEPAVAAGTLVPILPRVRWRQTEAHLLYPRTRHLSARVRALVDFLAAELAGEPRWDVVFGDPGSPSGQA